MSEDLAPLPTNAEDLKRHKALSAMESSSTVSSDDVPSSSQTTTDPSALGEALGSITSAPAPAPAAKPTLSVKVKAEDVNFVVEHLDLPKAKATDLLRRNAGDLVASLRAFVKAA